MSLTRRSEFLPSLDEWRDAMARYAADGNLQAIKEASDVAEIYRQHAKSEEQQKLGGAAKLECAFFGGQALANDPAVGPGKYASLAYFFPDLSEDARLHLSSRWQKVYEVGREKLDAYIEAAEETPTYSGLLRVGAHVGQNSGENEWYTPAEYIKAAVAVMGGIDLDPASTEAANEVIGASQIYTEADNGLDMPWFGRVWMNPPYAQPLIRLFCEKLADDFTNENISEACVLVNNATETGWFHSIAEVASAICFPRGRLNFWHPERDSATPLQGQSVIYLGPHVEEFRAEFVQFGFTAAL